MKKQTIIAMLITTIALGLRADAKIWRVNKISNYIQNSTTNYGSNVGGSLDYPVFKEITDAVAYTAVNDNDTLHIENYNGLYNNAIITKKLIIIGPGYFLNQNTNVSNITDQPGIRGIRFNPGSAGSQLIGMNIIQSNNASDDIQIAVSNIIIKRCYILRSIYIANNLSNIQILQNYFDNPSGNNITALDFENNASLVMPTDVIFNNNICKRILAFQYAGNILSLLECKNNVFDCPSIAGGPSILINAASFQNNILKTINATVNINGGSNLNVSYNISASATNQFGNNVNNNIVVTNMAALFVDPAIHTTDGDYQLQPGSVAGSDGAERGAFGGPVTSRYTLSGLAAIPVIYEINTSGVATSTGLQVNIKARTIK